MIRRLLLVVLLTGCVNAQTRESPPPKTPEDLVAKVRHDARRERWASIYRCLDKRTREEYSETKFVLGLPTLEFPAPTDYKVTRVLAYADIEGIIVNPQGEREAYVYFSYGEQGKPRLSEKAHLILEDGAWKVVLPR